MVGPSVTSRVVDVVTAFGGTTHPLTLSEIARRAGLPLTTTHRIVGDLSGGGLLDRDPGGGYRIGLRLWEIAARSRPVALRETALPFMGDLYEATHENVQLAVLDGHDAVYVERLAGRRSVHVVTRPGARLPLHASGVGLVLLASAAPGLIDAVCNGPLTRFTPSTLTDPHRLRAVLAAVRRDGFVVSDRQVEMISVSVAAPVRDAAGDVVAALSVVVAAAGPDPHTFVPAVRTAARGISRALAG